VTVTRPCYFVVARDYFGREQPAIYWEELPRAPIRHMTYVVRLDLQPNAAALMAASLEKLFSVYLHLKSRGKLPPKWEPAPRAKSEPAKAKAGHREEHARRHLADGALEVGSVAG
jgi:hypothetical protein